jgi:hypothetical protein
MMHAFTFVESFIGGDGEADLRRTVERELAEPHILGAGTIVEKTDSRPWEKKRAGQLNPPPC